MERRKEQEKTNESQKGTAADDALHLAFVSTYPPRACGIATFTQDLVRELEKVPGIAAPSVVAMEREPLQYGLRVRSTIREQERADYVRAAERLNASSVDVVVIEHDLDVIRNADFLIDMGPGGGDAGGRIVACGTPEQICNDPASITGRYLRR